MVPIVEPELTGKTDGVLGRLVIAKVLAKTCRSYSIALAENENVQPGAETLACTLPD